MSNMPFQIVHNDITKMDTEAIVNAANSRLMMGGGVCGAIFRKAGPFELHRECDKIGFCPTGGAVITSGCGLSAKYIIHAVGPIWRGGDKDEEKKLRDAYTNSLKLAKEHSIKSIAFPLISSGIYGYPKKEALSVAVDSIRNFLKDNEMDVYLVVFDRGAVEISQELYSNIKHYIDEYYMPDRRRRLESESEFNSKHICRKNKACVPRNADMFNMYAPSFNESKMSLEDELHRMDETFTEYLFELIDEKGMTDTEVYKRANIDRKLFSKIRSNKDYKPKKQTILSLAISLRLSLSETEALLKKAGYSLSKSIRFDVIIKYFITHKNYDIYEINEALFCFNEQTLGA